MPSPEVLNRQTNSCADSDDENRNRRSSCSQSDDRINACPKTRGNNPGKHRDAVILFTKQRLCQCNILLYVVGVHLVLSVLQFEIEQTILTYFPGQNETGLRESLYSTVLPNIYLRLTRNPDA